MKSKAFLTLAVIILVLIMLPVFTACGDEGKTTNKLVIYNWEDYIDPTLLDDFSEYYSDVTGFDLEIVYTTFETNETMLTKMLQGDAQVDLICPSEYAIEKLMANGLIQNLTELQTSLLEDYNSFENLTFDNLVNIEEDITTKISEEFGSISYGEDTASMVDYMLPYMWGTLGILYNADFVTQADLDSGWAMLWNSNNNVDIQGKILVKDSVRDTYCASVMYMYENGLLPDGYENYSVQELINCVDTAMLNKSELVLTEQRQFISGYEVDFGKDDMIAQTALVDLAWSGDAMWAIECAEEEGINLDYFVPEIGGNIWFDGWVVPNCANNNLAALMFIDYMCAPENGIWNSMEIGYTSAISKELLQSNEDAISAITECEYDVDEYFSDERRYPEITDKLGVMHDFGKNNNAVVAMWERAKAGSAIPMELVWSLIAVVVIVGLLILSLILKEKLKFRPRKLKINDCKIEKKIKSN
ncbi:MAG: extracellular solute-binding protein [Clostridia bacterium]|nr:extracellular solute-binding protein [Clostridia bacterium]